MKKFLYIPLSLILSAGLAVSAAPQSAGQSAGAAESQSTSTPVRAMLDYYLKIQESLARDSMNGIKADANSLASLVRENESAGLPPQVAGQAATLAEARHISKARDAFKPLSDSIIACVKTSTSPGTYYEFYCRPLHASWLQASPSPMDPYMGLRAENPFETWGYAPVEKGIFTPAGNYAGN
jgi:hypothetical protein